MSLTSRTKPFRGQVFTIDAVIALLFAVAFLSLTASSVRNGTSTFPAFSAVQNYADDIATVLDKTGTLASTAGLNDSAASNRTQLILNQTMPFRTSGSASVSFYQYAPGGSCTASCQLDGTQPANELCRCRTFSVTAGNSTAANASATGQALRVFYANASGTTYLGLATITAWTP